MQKDVFGRAGDFITAPEISQSFGEVIGEGVCSTMIPQSCYLDDRFKFRKQVTKKESAE